MNCEQYGRYKTVEVSMNKRFGNKWSAPIGGSYTWLHDFPNGYPEQPEQPGVEDRTTWHFKASAAPTTRLGHPAVAGPAPSVGRELRAHGHDLGRRRGSRDQRHGTASYVEPANANREDNIWVFDIRTEKTVNFTRRIRTRVIRPVQHDQQPRVGDDRPRDRPGYQKPALILAPFTARVGFRFIF